MSNFLGLRCPKCGDQDRIDILAELWVRVTDADASGDGEHTYTPKSTALCGSCGHSARLYHFLPDDAVQS
jgi:hypothetical protein